jgi:phytoene dehydrogenase-like protein
LPEGCIYHGQMALDRLLVMRPVPGYGRYRTPIDGLYLCGAGSHPGGVTERQGTMQPARSGTICCQTAATIVHKE